MKSLDRFTMLEDARPAATADAPERLTVAHQVTDRFAAVSAEAPRAAEPPPPAAPVEHDAFAPPPELDHGYELEPRDARVTLRCAECGFENARSAHDQCARCRAPLDTRATRHLNEQLDQDERAAAFAAKRAAAARTAEEPPPEPPEPVEAPSAWPAFDRIVDRLARGRAATWSQPARRALVVATLAAIVGLLFLATHSPLIGFLLGLVITLGLCLVLT